VGWEIKIKGGISMNIFKALTNPQEGLKDFVKSAKSFDYKEAAKQVTGVGVSWAMGGFIGAAVANLSKFKQI
jgi:hypothetical protein